MMAALAFTQDDFIALGRQLTDAAIAAYQKALVDHAATINLPAPTAHPLIETVVKQYGSRYAIAGAPDETPPRNLGAELDALKAALVAKSVISTAELTAAAATMVQLSQATPVQPTMTG